MFGHYVVLLVHGFVIYYSKQHFDYGHHPPVVVFVSQVMNSDLIFPTVNIRFGFH
jgi:hypothetical protein